MFKPLQIGGKSGLSKILADWFGLSLQMPLGLPSIRSKKVWLYQRNLILCVPVPLPQRALVALEMLKLRV